MQSAAQASPTQQQASKYWAGYKKKILDSLEKYPAQEAEAFCQALEPAFNLVKNRINRDTALILHDLFEKTRKNTERLSFFITALTEKYPLESLPYSDETGKPDLSNELMQIDQNLIYDQASPFTDTEIKAIMNNNLSLTMAQCLHYLKFQKKDTDLFMRIAATSQSGVASNILFTLAGDYKIVCLKSPAKVQQSQKIGEVIESIIRNLSKTVASAAVLFKDTAETPLTAKQTEVSIEAVIELVKTTFGSSKEAIISSLEAEFGKNSKHPLDAFLNKIDELERARADQAREAILSETAQRLKEMRKGIEVSSPSLE